MAQPCTPGYREGLWQDRGNRGSDHTAIKTRASAICTKNKSLQSFRGLSAVQQVPSSLNVLRQGPKEGRPCCSACKLGPCAGAGDALAPGCMQGSLGAARAGL
ncbi:unnamed protein product [Gulo gulo]|uniref:Uncharacterized protein n=1 Tax=Gulo gulo TaxID=48420 RepID=A0A9X9LRF2_GULGU|nr:unnamed protein product [Gulo gulo]